MHLSTVRLRRACMGVLGPIRFSSTGGSLRTQGRRDQIPVAIAGGGPTGLVLSILLSKLGVPSLLFERSPQLTTHPQAHYINNRTMEIFRPLDGLAEEVASLSPPLEEWRRFVYCRSLTGEPLGSVDHFQDPGPPVSPVHVAHLAQSRLLPLLYARAAAAAGRVGRGADILLGHEVRGFAPIAWEEEEGGGVNVEISPTRGGPPRFIMCRHLIAADGASSPIRERLGISMKGEPAMQQLINVHFSAPSLGASLADASPAMLYFVFNPDVVAVIVAHDLKAGEFVAQVPFYPPAQSPGDFTPEVCARLVAAAAGPAAEGLLGVAGGLEVREVRPWTMSAEVAASYGRGRVLLAGDAAHRFPPAGGFGMNTGIQDAHNLAWKLAAVHRGDAPPSLLASYGPERRPVARANADLSVRNYWDAMAVPRAMGMDPRAASGIAAAVGAAASAAPLLSSALPWVARGLVELPMAVGRRVLASESGPLRPLQDAAVARVFAERRTLRLNFPHEDLGFRYGGPGAALAGGGRAPPAAAATGRDQGAYRQVAAVGGRLPHCSVAADPDPCDGGSGGAGKGPEEGVGEGGSTLDVATGIDPRLVLVVEAGEGGSKWRAAASRLASRGEPLAIAEVACEDGGGSEEGDDGVGVRRLQDQSGGAWARLRGVGKRGALLVRPDGHIAWMGEAGFADPEGALQAAIARTLHRSGAARERGVGG